MSWMSLTTKVKIENTDAPARLGHFSPSSCIFLNRMTQRSLLRGCGTSIGDDFMRTKHQCVFTLISTKDEVGAFKHFKPSSKISFTDCSKAVQSYNKTFIDFNFGRHKDLSTRKSDNSTRPPGRGEYHF